jgi:hypothetical protein
MSARRTMWEWRVILNIPDYLTMEREDVLLDCATEAIDGDQIRHFVEDKLKDVAFIEVEVLE